MLNMLIDIYFEFGHTTCYAMLVIIRAMRNYHTSLGYTTRGLLLHGASINTSEVKTSLNTWH
jgi:hypothetical protein